MAFELPTLNYKPSAFAGKLSEETFEFHYGKHHQAYINTTNKLIEGTDLEDASLETVIMTAREKADNKLFNQSAQIWNHNFYWDCLSPKGGGKKLPDTLAKKIAEDIGTFDDFRDKFVAACTSQFGSGWGWLALDNTTGKLEVLSTSNADLPMTQNKTALLTCDVWEHAYYIDYRNARPKYVEMFVDELANWDFVEAQLLAGPKDAKAA